MAKHPWIPALVATIALVAPTASQGAGAVAACRARDLAVRAYPAGGGLGTAWEGVSITARSGPCSLRGYPVVRLLNSRGREPNLRSQQSRSGFASTTLRLRVIRLEPGSVASFVLAYRDCPNGRHWRRCPVIRRLVLALPGGTAVAGTTLRPCYGYTASPFAPGLLAIRRTG
jgi:Protein of unknown function (DUF4232)